ncbi:hypothetical protein BJV77DRAFT_977110 [Russula vinacea]|nr:hypothetical protein BJV77DRAFT_977110 [Russula vinacea]
MASSADICTDCAPSSNQQPTYNPTDPSTFVAPRSSAARSVIIEFSPGLQSVTIIPLDSDDAVGRFRIWLTLKEDGPPILVWDRKVEGQFPELKHLKQRIRDHIQPERSLGHSDK